MHKTGTLSHAQWKMLACIPQKGIEASEIRKWHHPLFAIESSLWQPFRRLVREEETGCSETCLDTKKVV